MSNSVPMQTSGDGMPSDRVDAGRLWQRLGTLAKIGATIEGGVDRPALSPLELAARRQAIAWANELGAEVSCDPAGNLFFWRHGSEPTLAAVLTGSYLDSQPGGGKYAGAYGMVAALEALAAIAASGRPPKRSVAAVCWTNGEGSRFTPGYTGSELFAGLRPMAQAFGSEDAAGNTLGDELAKVLAGQGALAQRPLGFVPGAYLEVHLEQGPALETAGKQIGIVTGVQGVRRFQVQVVGEAAHLGTVQRQHRRDALRSTVRIINTLDQFFSAPDMGFAVSQLRVKPNAPSIVPHEATFSVAVRHRENQVLKRMGDTIRLICESEKGLCGFTMVELASTPAVTFDPAVPAVVTRAATALGLAHTSILSLGGHDAQSLHHICPSGIVFVPCKGGISHNAAEEIAFADAEAGAKVLADGLWDLANR